MLTDVAANGRSFATGVHAYEVGDGVHEQQAPAAQLVPCGWATAGERIVQDPVVAHLAHHLAPVGPHPQDAGTPAVHDAVGGQLGHDQGHVLQAAAGKTEPRGLFDREEPGARQLVGMEGEFLGRRRLLRGWL